MKTAELTGAHLDYWVAMAEGLKPIGIEVCEPVLYDDDGMIASKKGTILRPVVQGSHARYGVPFYSTDWEKGGPIIDRGRITVGPRRASEEWHATVKTGDSSYWHALGGTPLIAAMRAYVASKFGDTVPDQEKS